MAILETLENIYTVGKTIYDIVETVQANKAQCKRLAERVKLVEDSLRGLSDYPSSTQFASTLNKLNTHLEAIAHFVGKFSQKSTFKQTYKYSTYQARFVELNAELGELIPMLNLGLTTHQVVNQIHDEADQASDQAQWDQLLAQQAEIQAGQDRLLQQGQKVGEQVEGVVGYLQQRDASFEQHIQAGFEKNQQEQAKMWAFLQQLQDRQPQGAAAEEPSTQPTNTIQLSDLILSDLLSEGQGGKVHQGEWLGESVAVKTLSGHYTQQAQEALVRDMKVLQHLRHPRIVSFYGWCADNRHAYLVMEYCDQRDLSRHLQQHPTLELKTKRQIALDIAQGLQYLHREGLLHRDLNSHHVLLDHDMHAKLTDFRVSKDPAMQTLQSIHPSRPNLAWRAPETLGRKSDYTAASDVYSFGIILCELMTQQIPFSDREEDDILGMIQAGERPTLPADCPVAYTALIEACWSPAPDLRPNMTEIIDALQRAPVNTLTPEQFYETGKNHERAGELTEALNDYRHAADKGYAKALTAVGMFHLQGRGGLSQDKAEAHSYFQRGAEGGHSRAMHNLGEQLKSGDGVPRDQTRALFWFDRAAELGNPGSAETAARLRARIAAQSNSNASASANSNQKTAAMAP